MRDKSKFHSFRTVMIGALVSIILVTAYFMRMSNSPEPSLMVGMKPLDVVGDAQSQIECELAPQSCRLTSNYPTSWKSEAKRIAQRLSKAHYTYNAIKEMWRGKPRTIALRISALEAPTLPAAIDGKRVTGIAGIAPEISAVLRGTAGLMVEDLTPLRIRLSQLADASWQWNVTPLVESDKEVLTLSLYAHVIKDGSAITIKTLDEKVEVKVTGWQRLSDAVKSIEPSWAFGAGSIPVIWGLFVWTKSRGWAKPKPPKPPHRSHKAKVRDR